MVWVPQLSWPAASGSQFVPSGAFSLHLTSRLEALETSFLWQHIPAHKERELVDYYPRLSTPRRDNSAVCSILCLLMLSSGSKPIGPEGMHCWLLCLLACLLSQPSALPSQLFAPCHRQHTKLSQKNTTRDPWVCPRTESYFTRLPILPQIMHDRHDYPRFIAAEIDLTSNQVISDISEHRTDVGSRGGCAWQSGVSPECRVGAVLTASAWLKSFSSHCIGPTTHRLTGRSAQPLSNRGTPDPLHTPTWQSRLLPISNSYCFLW